MEPTRKNKPVSIDKDNATVTHGDRRKLERDLIPKLEEVFNSKLTKLQMKQLPPELIPMIAQEAEMHFTQFYRERARASEDRINKLEILLRKLG